MTKKADEEKAKVQQLEQALQDYIKANDIVTVQDKMAITPEKLSEFNTQLIRAETKRKELEGLYHKVSNINLRDAEKIPTIPSYHDNTVNQGADTSGPNRMSKNIRKSSGGSTPP